MFNNKNKLAIICGEFDKTVSGYASAKKCYLQAVKYYGLKHVFLSTNGNTITVGLFGYVF